MLLVNDEKFTLLDKVVCGYIFIEIFLMTSSLLSYHLTKLFIYGPPILFCGIVFCLVSMKRNLYVKRLYISIILLVALCGIINFLRFGNILLFTYVKTIIFSTIVLMLYKEKYLEVIVKIGTPFFIFLLIGAFIGFGYAISGRPPIFEFPNPDGRMNYCFLTTCTNTYISQVIPGMTNIIRPSGIYDEPGTFSFFLCILAVFRVLTGKSDILTFFMLLAGNITFSTAHAIFFLFYNVYMFGKYYKKKIFLAYIAIAMLGTISLLYQYYDIFDKMLFYRLQGEELTNNNRSVQVDGSLRILKNAGSLVDVVLFGDQDVERKEGFIATNPLGPLVYHGLFVSWVYYTCMSILLFGGVVSKKYRFVLWAIALVYTQRPVYAQFGGSTALYIITFYSANIAYSEVKNIFGKRKKLVLCKIQ